MPELKTLKNLDVSGKKVLLRVDLNVPMLHGKISDSTRIARVIPTIKHLVKNKAKVILLSHFGRPKGEFVRSMSLAPITNPLAEFLSGIDLKFAVDCIGEDAENAVKNLKNGEVLLMENLRFHKGEEKNSKEFADALAKLGDIFVNDAFSCSHRSHASITGLAERLPSACGFLLEDEIKNLSRILEKPEKPIAAIVGGSKISTKLELLENLIKKTDYIIIGGGMANTFLAAKGYKIGKSLYEKDLLETSKKIISAAEKNGCTILLPRDVIVAKTIDAKLCRVFNIDKIPQDEMILDIGQNTVFEIGKILEKCKTVIWNGPLGAFEFKPFDVASSGVARIIAGLTTEGKIKSVAGGGDVNAAIDNAGLMTSFTYISTAGGAFLEWLEGKNLPGISVLYK